VTRAWSLALVGSLVAGAAVAQTVPDGSPALQVPSAYRRGPQFRIDPFRHTAVPQWGFVIEGGGIAGNNALNLSDIGALIVLADSDAVLTSDLLNAVALVPAGNAAVGDGQAEGGLYVGGPIGEHVSVGITAQGRAYGSYVVDRDAVAMLREGNSVRQTFDVGQTTGTGLGTGELGVHALVRLEPIGSQDGARLSVGFGGRYIEPLAYGREETTLRDDVPILVSGDSIAAHVDLRAEYTPDVEFGRGSGYALDVLVRVEWPTSGLYLEALATNLGKVTVDGVERSTLAFSVATTDLGEVVDSLDTADFIVQDTTSVSVSLPRVLRFSAGAWANRYLQLDASASLPIGGDFDVPVAVDLWSTWRFMPILPIRLGLVLGGTGGIGYTAGLGVETRHFYLGMLGGSFGGLFKDATGVAGRFELGVFF
jgi:hypothetical protein